MQSLWCTLCLLQSSLYTSRAEAIAGYFIFTSRYRLQYCTVCSCWVWALYPQRGSEMPDVRSDESLQLLVVDVALLIGAVIL